MNSAEVAEIKRHFEVVAERIEGRVQLVAEAVFAADAKIETLRQEMWTEFEETRAPDSAHR